MQVLKCKVVVYYGAIVRYYSKGENRIYLRH